jgi:hypothetical protein
MIIMKLVIFTLSVYAPSFLNTFICSSNLVVSFNGFLLVNYITVKRLFTIFKIYLFSFSILPILADRTKLKAWICGLGMDILIFFTILRGRYLDFHHYTFFCFVFWPRCSFLGYGIFVWCWMGSKLWAKYNSWIVCIWSECYN